MLEKVYLEDYSTIDQGTPTLHKNLYERYRKFCHRFQKKHLIRIAIAGLDNGEQVCLSYLLRGGCWSTCKCMATHGHQPAPAEHTKLTAYLRTQKQKLNTGGQHAPVSP
jgi:hypothetical protein